VNLMVRRKNRPISCAKKKEIRQTFKIMETKPPYQTIHLHQTVWGLVGTSYWADPLNFGGPNAMKRKLILNNVKAMKIKNSWKSPALQHHRVNILNVRVFFFRWWRCGIKYSWTRYLWKTFEVYFISWVVFKVVKCWTRFVYLFYDKC